MCDSEEVKKPKAQLAEAHALLRDLLELGICETNWPELDSILTKAQAALSASAEPSAPVERDDPCKWSDRQILEFLGVALRNVDLQGEVRLSEIRQGFEYMRDRAALERKP